MHEAPRFVTIGHSTRSLSEFIDLLQEADVAFVADVRKLRGSRAYPHFDEDALSEALASAKIGYRALAELSGRRPKSRDVDPTVNGVWRNQSFHNYADYALSETFGEGLRELRELGAEQAGHAVAIMCAEAVWWRCHRRIIADYLLAVGQRVEHVLGPGQKVDAVLTEGASVDAHCRVTYPTESKRAAKPR